MNHLAESPGLLLVRLVDHLDDAALARCYGPFREGGFRAGTRSQHAQQHQRLSLSGGSSSGSDANDVYFVDAGKFIIEKEKASIGMLQRMFKIGFNRAARIMDQLSDAGVVGPEEGTKPRKEIFWQLILYDHPLCSYEL